MLTLTGIVSIVKSGRWPGVVTAFITMSDIRDEIDWNVNACSLTFVIHHLNGLQGRE